MKVLLSFFTGVLISFTVRGQNQSNIDYSCTSSREHIMAEYLEGLSCLDILTAYGTSQGCEVNNSNIEDDFGIIRIPVRLIRVLNQVGASPFLHSELLSYLDYANSIFNDFGIHLFLIEAQVKDIVSGSIYDFYNNALIKRDGKIEIVPLSQDYEELQAIIAGMNFQSQAQPLNLVFAKSVSIPIGNPDQGYNPSLRNGLADFPNGGNVVLVSHPISVNFDMDRAKILVHEVGHSLGLFHPFDTLSEQDIICKTKDYIEDTEVDSGNNCVGTTCINFMSYEGNNRTSFTEFQKKKMRDMVTSGELSELFAPMNPPVVERRTSPGSIPLGHPVTFEVNHAHAVEYHSADAVQWELEVNGVTYIFPPSADFTVSTGDNGLIQAPGTYTLRAVEKAPYHADLIGPSTSINFTIGAPTDEWRKEATPFSHGFKSIFFLDDKLGWIGGTNQQILKTVDGGLTWESTQTPDGPYVINRLFFLNASLGWACGGNGLIWQSNDGGETWHPQNSGLSTEDLYDIHFASTGIGFAVGAFVILSTENGGTTWESINVSRQVRAVKMINEQKVFLAGDDGLFFVSEDGGEQYSFIDLHTSASLKDIFFLDSQTGFLSGGDAFFYTTNGGDSWTREQYLGAGKSVHFLSGNEGFLLGDKVIHHTQDRGNTWSATSLVQLQNGDLWDQTFLDNSIGYIVGYGGTLLRRNANNVASIQCSYPTIGVSGQVSRSIQSQQNIFTENQTQITGPVLLEAGSTITLNPGFVADGAHSFVASIDECAASSFSSNTSSNTSKPSTPKTNIEFSQKKGIRIHAFPNPASEVLTLESFVPEGMGGELCIYSIDGSLKKWGLSNLPDGKSRYEVSVSTWSSGMYLIQLQTSIGTEIRKVVISRLP